MPTVAAMPRITIDLPKQEIRGPDGGTVKFDIDPFRKHCLLNGLDDIAPSAWRRLPPSMLLKRSRQLPSPGFDVRLGVDPHHRTPRLRPDCPGLRLCALEDC